MLTPRTPRPGSFGAFTVPQVPVRPL